MIDLKPIEAREKAATEGQVILEENTESAEIVVGVDVDAYSYSTAVFCLGDEDRDTAKENKANAEFYIKARQDVPDLIAEVKRLREALEKVSKAANGNKDYYSVIIGILEAQALKG